MASILSHLQIDETAAWSGIVMIIFAFRSVLLLVSLHQIANSLLKFYSLPKCIMQDYAPGRCMHTNHPSQEIKQLMERL